MITLLVPYWRGLLTIVVLMTYLVIQHYYRYDRVRKQRKLFNYPDRQSLGRMTNDDAWAIQRYIATLEFPQLYEVSLQFALFKTYGIPSISSLLMATGQFSSTKYASKRYADTMTIFSEISSNLPTSKRAIAAIARMNYIHGVYQKSGKISNDDMVFTISLAALSPREWIRKYEWRELDDMEQCAIGTFWKSVGDAMNIDFSAFEHGNHWKDGLEWLEDARNWCDKYEQKFMVPHSDNHKLAEHTVDLLLSTIPVSWRGAGLTVVTCLMDDRLRKAMIYPEPPKAYHNAVLAIFNIRRLFHRYIALPRPQFLSVTTTSPTADPRTEKYYQTTWQKDPWYVQPTFLSRWGPSALIRWILAGGKSFPRKGKSGEKFANEGYTIEELGPNIMKGRGGKEMQESINILHRTRTGGCPFFTSGENIDI
ncbi:hypothetical protein F5884DRAFT_853497 [Xylogone sp. PMI_703]|nr:hypothetical protein F5884DRAFT_853497 [Xylogone sp. PMI_703]